MGDASSAADWAAIVTDAYCADAKPPLTQELAGRVRDALAQAVASPAGDAPGSLLDRLNDALDAFETELRSVVGPRVTSLDEATGAATMKPRSEAGQPLRAFGGQ
ncbi:MULTISPECIES: hypothetical protein [unclassified Methylobacterium]|uniref:hypothetical protein n=1 Tax=unclassified Methylobacterium TaxID=2615210 RepID=UPI0008A7E069|nr:MULTISPECIES: hypothetical protein [unclassified Methylobacterium]SEH81846.1 hypothetical protein SAMN02799636_04022 [Methylobacterium sp. 275MFSha3.1]SFE20270.1 hypothetical protein SAMN02799627_02860 [Methylobacterium sp. 13MFTsu3.1M2]SFT15283.1 hypothetical protein SAMN04487845_11984 [Methylobacterium sp. yr668]